MALQNFVNQVGPPISASWLNGVDVAINQTLGGGATPSAVLQALGLEAPFTVANGGTGATTASQALANLGGTTLIAVEAAINQAFIGEQLYPQTSIEQSNGVTPTQYQYPPYTAFRYMTAAQTTAVLTGNQSVDVVTPLQTMCNIIQANGGVIAIFPAGIYSLISAPLVMKYNGYYEFQSATLFGNATSAQSCVVHFQAAYSQVYNLSIQGNYNTNYSCALLWDSLGVGSSQSNTFFELDINNILVGVIYGALTTPAAAVQSENYIHGCHIAIGIQNAIIMNQPNGILKVIGGQLTTNPNGWTVGAGNYVLASSYVAEVTNGALQFYGCDLEKTSTTVGSGLVNNGGLLQVCGGSWEIACTVLQLAGGYTNITDISGNYWSNAVSSFCLITGNGAPASLHMGNYVLNKSVGAASANTAFIDFQGFTGWEISLTDLRLENQLNLIFNNGNSQPNIWNGNNSVQLYNVYSPNAGGAGTTPYFQRVSSDTNNVLDVVGTDVISNDITTWYKRDITGTGAIALNSDVPSGANYANSVMVTPAAGGSSAVYSLNLTSLTTVKATGIKCRPGDTFMLTGWYRLPSGGPGQVSVLGVNASGTAQATVDPADSTTILSGVTAWLPITCLFVVPAACYYIGVGCWATATNPMRMVGLKLTKLATE